MNILQAPVELGGRQLSLTAHGLREIGHTAHTFFQPGRYVQGLSGDYHFRATNRWLRRLEVASRLASFAARYHVFHFHFADSLLGEAKDYADARWLKRMGRKVFIEFWGSDVRIPSIAAERNPYFVNTRDVSDSSSRERLQRWADIADGRVIMADHSMDPFLQPYFERVHVVGQRIDTRRFQPRYPDPEAKRPIVVHAPSHLPTKGTHYVRQAVENLQARRLPFEYREVHGMRQEEALDIYAQADLIVDQLMLGSHGILAVEAMALGKPVICYILPEMMATYPKGFPIINANPDTFESVLEEWLQRPADRSAVGQASRCYVEGVHDCRVVARKLVKVYQGEDPPHATA